MLSPLQIIPENTQTQLHRCRCGSWKISSSWTMKEAAERSCRFFIIEDTKDPSGHGLWQPAQVPLLSGLGLDNTYSCLPASAVVWLSHLWTLFCPFCSSTKDQDTNVTMVCTWGVFGKEHVFWDGGKWRRSELRCSQISLMEPVCH